jgi:hypothetical protein
MQWLKQSTAATVKVGPFIDSTDGDTAEIGLTISQADVRLSKNGGNIAQKSEVSACTHDELGYYDCNLDATDTGTLGRLQVMVHESGALPVWHEYMVLPANVYDSLVAGSDLLQADATQISGDGTAADNAEAFFDNTGFVASNSTIGTTTTNTDMRGTDSAALAATALTNAIWTDARAGYLDELGAANIPADLDAVLADTGTDGVLLAATATSAQLVDDVWDEVLTAATHNVSTSAGRRMRELSATSVLTGTATAGTANSITLDSDASTTARIYDENLIVITAGTGVGQTRLIAEYTAGRVATVDRDWAVTPDATSEYQVIAFSGILLTDHGLAQAGAAGTITLAATASAVDDTYVGSVVVLTTGTAPGQARLVTAYNGTSKVATITPNWETNPDVTTVYKVIPVGRSIVGSMQADSITAAALATDAVNEIVDAVWDEAQASHVGAGTFGEMATETAAILADTNELQTDDYPTSIAAVQTTADAIETDTQDLQTQVGTAGAGLTALPWNAAWDAEIESEALDALNTQLADSIPVDGTLPTLRQALYMVTQYLYERAVSGTTVTVKKVDGSTSLLTLTLDDGSDPTSITRAT